MIGSPDLFRSWNEVGSNGLTDVQRYVRTEYRDGNWTAVVRPSARLTGVEGTLLHRLASALHLIPARTSLSAASPAAGIHAGIAAVHLADEPTYAGHRSPAATSAALLVTSEGECEGHDVECHQL